MVKANRARRRLDEALLSLGYFSDLKTAQGWVMAGKVVVNGIVSTKPGTPINLDAEILLRDRPLRYVSRGGYKLEHALARFEIPVTSRVSLDAGASTGGFTDCLLQHGAERVYAVDVGFGQLRGKLAADQRVINRERTNISDVKTADLDPPIDFACADLSYLTMRKAVPIVGALFRTDPLMVFLIKPLYEGLPREAMVDAVALESILRNLFTDLAARAYPASDVCVSPLLGGHGAMEFLACFGHGAPRSPQALVQRALEDLQVEPPQDLWTFLGTGPAAEGRLASEGSA